VWSFTTVPAVATLPSPWTQQDIGNVGVAGSASVTGGVFTVSGAGTDIGGTSDSFHFVDQTVAGDGQIVARLTSLQKTSAKAKAGVSLRGTLDPGAPAVTLALQANGSVLLLSRSAAGATTKTAGTIAQNVPVWLKLTRAGSTITGFVSTNGTTWTQVGTTAVDLPATIYVGLAVTSHTTGSAATATFDNAAVSTLP